MFVCYKIILRKLLENNLFFINYRENMSNNNKIQTGINNISNEWFRANIDRKTLKNLSKRTDYEGWKHIIIFTLSLTGLGILSAYFWQTWWFIPVYLSLIHILTLPTMDSV